jgi:organic radical activating enzyme
MKTKTKLCLVYQLFTKCNIGCKYCYNYFDQDILPYDYYTSKLEKLLELVEDDGGLVLNGGEPLLLKDFDKLVNLSTSKAKTFTYTNGTLSTLHYKKFVESLENKDKLYMTLSLHFQEILKDNKLPEKYFRNINAFARKLPNFKVNLVVNEVFNGEYLEVIRQTMREIKERTDLKYLNILIADHLYDDEFKLLRLLDKEFCDVVRELDENFIYKNCLWDNTRQTFTEMVNDIKENAYLKIAGKEFKIPYQKEFGQIAFLESPKGIVVEDHLDDTYVHSLIPYKDFDTFVEDLKLKTQTKPLRTINRLSSVGVI